MITNHTDFYKKWMENMKPSDRIGLVISVLDMPGSRNILMIDKNGNIAKSSDVMPEIKKILSLFKANHNIMNGGYLDIEEVTKQYINWNREISLEKIL